MVRCGLGFLAGTDAAGLPGEVQAQCLEGLEQFDAMSTAARARMLGAFANAQGYLADGAYSAKMWLFHRTRVTKGAAAGHAGWAWRAAAHPRVIAALGAAEISVSWARSICDWNDRLPERGREALEMAVIGTAVELVSGPGGLASFLRRRQLGARLGGPSLPLDVGYSDTVPAGIRTAVRLRDQHCRWPGGCFL